MRALLSYPFIVLATAGIGAAALIVSLFDPDRRAQHRLNRFWAFAVLRAIGVKLRVEGGERLDPNRSYVIACNHRSLVDTPVVLASLPLQFRFMAKRELFQKPLMGLYIRRTGCIEVARDNPRAALRTLSAAAQLMLKRGLSVLLFSEGGRSEDGLADFKEGAAFLAIKAGAPVAPIGIEGSGSILRKRSWRLRSGPVTVRIGEPIPTQGLKPSDRSHLTQEVRQRVAELMHLGR